MVDITEISAIVAAAGVLVGVFFTVIELRNLSKQRRTDLAFRLSPSLNLSADVLQEAISKVWNMKYKDYDDYVEKYGPLPNPDKPELKALELVEDYLDSIGLLVKTDLLDIDFAWKLYGHWYIGAWERLKTHVEGTRKRTGNSAFRRDFEYLANELKKREQQLQQGGVKSG